MNVSFPRHQGALPADDPRSESGMGLVIAILIMAIVSAIGSTIIAANMADLQISNNYSHRSTAFYAADSGIDVTISNLKGDPSWIPLLIDTTTWQPISPVPTGVTVDGLTLTSVGNNYWQLGSTATLGGGTYTRTILLPPVVNVTSGDGTVTFTVRSTGNGGVVDPSTQVVRSDVELEIRGYGVWDNAIFAADGAAGNLINGNVEIRGSVHIIGDENNPPTIDFSGTADIKNNYEDGPAAFGTDFSKLPALTPEDYNGEMVETLETTVRLENANIDLGGDSDIGEPDATGDGYKETIDAVRSDGTITPPSQVSADEWSSYDATGVEFPTLDDPYTADDGSTWATHRDFLENRSLLINESEISGNINDFSYSDAWGNSISWDKSTQTLTVNGIVRVNQDLRLGKPHGTPGDRGFTYQGTGTFYAPGEIEIDGPVVPVGNYITDGNLGLIADTDVKIDYTAQINVFAAIYAEDQIYVSKQTDIAGAMVSRFFDMGTNVPSIYHVPILSTNLPPGMPGDGRISVIRKAREAGWYQER